MPTPYARIRASAIGISNIARALAMNDRLPDHVRNEATKIVLLAADIPYDIDAVKDLVDCYERDMKGLLQEGLEREQTITAMEEAALRSTTTHNDDASISAPMPIPLSREPRRAASGE